MHMNTRSGVVAGRVRRGFSLIELLAVIGIIGIVVALVVPALGMARDSARRQETVSVGNQITQACLSFQQSQGRLPGYFSPRVMARPDNVTRGFTWMQNAMLDLMGGVSASATPGTGEMFVGPSNNDRVVVAPDTIGTPAGGGGYLSASNKYFRLAGTASSRSAAPSGYAWCDNEALARGKAAEWYDAFGGPLALWVIDDSIRGEVVMPGNSVAQNTFAQLAAPTNPNQPSARFYWNSNAAYFTANSFTYVGFGSGRPPSLLNDSESDNNRRYSLMGLLGNPASPKALVDAANAPLPTDQIIPSAARGQVIVHGPGKDRTFLGRWDRGGRRAVGAGAMFYGLSFPAGGGTASDIVGEFDDVLVPGG
jgi:prepilin-type N-terminal cleavage/methylation domain-containing protein